MGMTTHTAPVTLNVWQKEIARSYDGGDYAYLAEKDEISDEDLDRCGDTLFQFLMIELADGEDCGTLEEAIRRCESARQQLNEAIRVLQTL